MLEGLTLEIRGVSREQHDRYVDYLEKQMGEGQWLKDDGGVSDKKPYFEITEIEGIGNPPIYRIAVIYFPAYPLASHPEVSLTADEYYSPPTHRPQESSSSDSSQLHLLSQKKKAISYPSSPHLKQEANQRQYP